MNRFLCFLYSIFIYVKNHIASFYNTYWASIDTNLKSAIIAAVVTFVGIFLQNRHERNRSEEQQRTTEENKLKYLQFLITDSFKVLEFYRLSALGMEDSARANPYVIPALITYVPHSLNTIANKINQEEYYLASINQIKSEEIAELFQLYNSLNDSYTKAVDYYGVQFPLLISDKDAYRTGLSVLIESLNEYLTDNEEEALVGDPKIIYQYINTLMGNINNAHLDFQGNEWLRDAKGMFVETLNASLLGQGDPQLRNIYKETRTALELDRNYRDRMFNVAENFKTNRLLQEDLLKRIKGVGAPLDAFVKTLKK